MHVCTEGSWYSNLSAKVTGGSFVFETSSKERIVAILLYLIKKDT